MKRALASSLLALTLACAGLLASAPAALAHAGLVSSDPAAGATLATAPTQITLSFTEAPDLGLSTVHVLDTSGGPVQTGPVTTGSATNSFSVSLPGDLPDGSYTVSWRVVSAQDGHVTAGTFAFGVGRAPASPTTAAPADTSPPPSPLGVVGKVFLYAGLALIVGAAATGRFAFGGHVPARRLLLPIAGGSALLGAVLMLFAERSAVGVSMGALLHSSTGRAYIWLLIGALATALAALYASRDPAPGALAAAGLTAVITMFTRAEGGHAGAGAHAWIQIGLQWLHFVAVGVWVGGFVPVLLLLRERRPATGAVAAQAASSNGDGTARHHGAADEPPAPDPITAVQRYSTMAGIALLVVVVTGLIRAVSELGGVGKALHLFSTSYGTTLGIKVAVALVLIALGAANRTRSIPRMTSGGGDGALRRLVGIEVVAAVGVFTLTGVLTGLPPNPPPAPPSAPAGVEASGADFATTMKVHLEITPGVAGTNTFDAHVTQYDSGAPLDATGVSLAFTPVGLPDVAPSQLELRATGPGEWSASGPNLSLSGAWQIEVQVQSSSTGTTIPLYVSTLEPDQQVAVQAQAGEPTLYTITFPGGQQIQAYNDPGATGANQLHLTAFDATGKELPLASVVMVATPPGGPPKALDAQRFSPGHFVASVDLTAGAWHFDLQATAKDGTALAGSFDQTIG